MAPERTDGGDAGGGTGGTGGTGGADDCDGDAPPDSLPPPTVKVVTSTVIEISWAWCWWHNAPGGVLGSSFDVSFLERAVREDDDEEDGEEEEWVEFTGCFPFYELVSDDRPFISWSALPSTAYKVRYRNRDAPTCLDPPGADQSWSEWSRVVETPSNSEVE